MVAKVNYNRFYNNKMKNRADELEDYRLSTLVSQMIVQVGIKVQVGKISKIDSA